MRQTKLDEWLEEKYRKIQDTPRRGRWQHWKETLPFTNNYREIKIPKKKGGYRNISIPPKELKQTQGGILRFLQELWGIWHMHICGLYRGSYIEHARVHSKSRFVFQFDIKDAFPSVNILKLERILYRKIIQENVVNTVYEANQLANLIITLTTSNGILPQGAPTSPFLFYIYLLENRLIEKLYKCSSPGFEISCYVDGIVISSQESIPLKIQERMIRTIEGMGFKINKKKIWLRDCRHGNPMITGISIDGNGKISLPKRKIRRWRGIIHRAAFETDPEKIEKLRQKIEGFIASLKPIYGKKPPPQIKRPYLLFKQNQINPPKKSM